MKRLFALLITALIGLVGVPAIARAGDVATEASPIGSQPTGFLSAPVAMGLTVGSLLWISIALAGLALGAWGLRRTRGSLVGLDVGGHQVSEPTWQ